MLTKMLTLEQVKECLKDSNLSLVSKSSGVNYNTLVKLVREENRDPAYSTVKALSDYILRIHGQG